MADFEEVDSIVNPLQLGIENAADIAVDTGILMSTKRDVLREFNLPSSRHGMQLVTLDLYIQGRHTTQYTRKITYREVIGVFLHDELFGPRVFFVINVQDAVKLWCSDPAAAEAKYGHISTWNVSHITEATKRVFDF
jgi:hypothetical protein